MADLDDLMPRVLTTGRLDSLTITPMINEQDEITHLQFAMDGMPGIIIAMEGAAACELRDALTTILALRPIAKPVL